jgi:hypothetical protein
MVTNDGNVFANVTWNVEACSYKPASRMGQTFNVSGTAALPSGVVNPNSVSLAVLATVTVRSAGSGGSPGGTAPGGAGSGGGCDAGLGGLGLLTVLASMVKQKRK